MSSTTEQNNCDVHLHAAAATAAAAAITEIEALKQALSDKQNQLIAMETVCLRESDRQVELEDSVIAWQDKYDRLYESHKRVQKVNQNLEDKLLKLVDRNASERAQLTSDVATLSVRLAQANFNIAKLQREIERYKADINLAIQLLQCKPDSFVSQKVSSLPIDIQSKVSSYMRLETNSHSDSDGSTSGVGVATSASYKVLPASDSPPPAPCPFPPTAMVYSMRGLDGKSNTNSTANLSTNNNNNSKESINNNTNNNNNNATTTCHSTSTTTITTTSLNNIATSNNLSHNDPDMISPVTMAKFLEDELKAGEIKHCDTCQCSKQDLTVLADVSRSYTVATQTPFQLNSSGNLNEPLAQLCLRCNSNLNSPSRTNSPYLMKLVKSSDSVISETKSSVSDLNDMDKLFIPAKKDDLMVNPILGHHRLCDRTSGSGALSAAANLLNSGTKLTSTMLYPTTHLGAYAAEKYLLETSSLAGLTGQLRSGYHRRFVDGGGTALEMLDKYEQKNEKLLDDLEADEAKPLLSSSMSHSNLMDACKTKIPGETHGDTHGEQIKSPASTCSATKHSLMKTTISGSVNSLWSKTSSCDGAKMFENFNRNLIKTIKAENPKHRGPRLCAMRIQQNGQSNILLDNIESIEAVSPILYKRRERLLDEELDDTKDIITSKTTSMPASSALPVQIEATGAIDEGVGATNDTLSSETDQWAKNACTQARHDEIEEECKMNTSPGSDTGGGSGEEKGGGGDGGALETTLASVEAKTEVKTAIDEVMVTNNIESIGKPDEITLLPDQNLTNSMMLVPAPFSHTELHAHLLENTSSSYEILRNESSSKNSLQSKSCTQSSSISDVIDFQESVLLRRQQLSRVAEWVQNNTQQLEQQQQKQQQQQVINALNHCGDSSGTDRQSSFSTLDQLDSVSMEKLSMDSGYKTTPQPQTNGGYSDNQQDDANKSTEDSLSPKTDTNSNHNNKDTNGLNNHHSNQHHQYHNPVVFKTNTLYRRTTRSGLPVAYTTTTTGHNNNNEPNANGHHSIVMTAQPTCDILNYKYYPSETDKTRSIKAELHTTTKNVDIAQMEYNVKQFLLKQNEWSMRCSRPPGGPATIKGGTNTTTSSNLSSVASQAMSQIAAAQKMPAAAALRHAKFFSNTSIGPGVGERVRIMPVNGGGVGNSQLPNAEVAVMRPTVPQRTETNL